MSPRTNKGYLWVYEQQDTWDDIMLEKIAQLDEITKTHLGWFEKHSTASDLISWKRPVLDSKRTNQVYSADSSQQETKLQIKESCNNKESNLERDSTIQTHQTESVTKQDTSVADSVQVNILYSPKSCSQTTNQVESPTRASFSETTQANDKDIKSNESVLSVNTLPPHSSLLLEAHIDEATHNNEQLIPDLVADVGNSDCQKGPSTPEEHYSIPLNRQDYNEHEDEIQLVVSTRNYEAEIQQQEQQQQKAARKVPSPIKPPSRSMISAPTIARHQSSFMSRLFKMTRPSINNSKKDPPLPTDMITTNRPSLNSVKSESTVIPIVTIIDQPSSQDIEVSEFMPTSGPRVKRRKLLVTSPVKSTSSNNNIPPKRTSTSNEKADTESTQEEEAFKIPDWARSPELRLNLQKQAGLDPHRIFGHIQPLQIRDIFPPFQKCVTEIPEHAPE